VMGVLFRCAEKRLQKFRIRGGSREERGSTYRISSLYPTERRNFVALQQFSSSLRQKKEHRNGVLFFARFGRNRRGFEGGRHLTKAKNTL